jgi:hypothetical protein
MIFPEPRCKSDPWPLFFIPSDVIGARFCDFLALCLIASLEMDMVSCALITRPYDSLFDTEVVSS